MGISCRRAWIALALAASIGTGKERPPGEAFAAGLKKAQSQVQKRKWSSGRKLLRRLLDEHHKQPYVRARAASIADLMKTCLFREKYGVPDPRKMVNGNLSNYNLATGRIRIKYKGSVSLGSDFERARGVAVHKAPFRGPYSLTFKGSRYPSGTSKPVPVVGLRKNDHFIILFGEAKRKYSRGRVVEQDAEIKRVRNTVASKSSPVKVGRPFVLQVKVNRKTIKVSYNGRAFLSADKEDDAWGFAGLVESSSFSELIIEGQAEPSWLQGLVDAEDAKHRKSFERTYDRKKHLPEWLFERVERREDLVAPVMERWPGALTKEQRQFATAAEVMLAKGLLDAGLSNMKQLPESALPTPARTYLRAKFLAAQGRPEDAMRTLAGVRASHADFYYGHALQGELLLSVGKTAEAVAVYDRLLEDYSGGGDFHAEATVFFLQLGRVDRAQEIVKGAKARGVSSKTLDTVDNIVAKAMNGPGFARRFEHQSAHYIVISNLDKATCRKASRLLERAYAAYVRDLGKVADRDKRRFPVYLFRGRGGFGDYCKDLFGVVPSRNSAGLYHLTLKQLLIWNLPEREQMLQTVRHEGFHQYLDRVMRNVPRWFNEGLAEYYETAGYRDGKWQSGGLRGSHLKIVRKHRIPLRQFLFLGPRAFMARAQQNYAQAWAFVYFLRHTTPARAELFKKFWNAYKTIGSPSGATKRALEGHDLDELDRAFRRWVEVPG